MANFDFINSSEAIFEKVQFWAKFDLLTLPTGGQEFLSKILQLLTVI